jgi:phosphoglucosamine mutase
MSSFFGTDGVRGRVGEFPIDAASMTQLGWAAGKAFESIGTDTVLIGKDTRLSGYFMEGALQTGLISAGVNVKLLGPMPTPGVAYLTKTFRADAGIVISASHNPYYDNGVKIFGSDGYKISDELQAKIEYYLGQPMKMVSPADMGRVYRVNEAAARYIEFCKSKFPSRFSLKQLKLVVDCAHGATYHIAPSVFSELGAEVSTIGVDPNGTNINEKVGATDTQALQQAVVEQQADLGIAFDGDGDRLIMVDKNGDVVDGDQLIFILARDALKNGRLKGGVVGTLMSNLGMELALKDLGIPFARANVGDRHVIAKLHELDWTIGGEGSGHILNLNVCPMGDAIVAALQVLTAIMRTNLPLHTLTTGMSKYPMIMRNIKTESNTEKAAMMANEKLLAAVADVEENMSNGRVLLRPSGTEPLIRIMVEGADPELVTQAVTRLEQVAKESLAQLRATNAGKASA